MSQSVSQYISLYELQSVIKTGIDNAHPLPYWVTAEVSELKVNYSGHCYIELVEKGGDNHVPRAKVNAVIWRNTYRMLAPYFVTATGQELAAGLKVLFKVVVGYHELYGLSLQIIDIDPAYTLGDMERQRQETINRLKQDGVFDMNRELELPLVMQRLAVVSSRNAAGYQDFMKEISSGGYRFRVTLFDAFMQGADAEDSIIDALGRVAERADDFDVVVLIRGGGSQSDLGCFNSYRLCCHLAQFPLPVVAGIGHDKDQSVADLVAAVSLKTPTAVAVYLCDNLAQFDAYLDDLYDSLSGEALTYIDRDSRLLTDQALRLKEVASDMVHGMELRLERLDGMLHRGTEALVRNEDHRLGAYGVQIGQGMTYFARIQGQRLAALSGTLQQRSRDYIVSHGKELSLLDDLVSTHRPERIMNMGFAVVRQNGETVLSGKVLRSGDAIEVQMYDAVVEANVNKIK